MANAHPQRLPVTVTRRWDRWQTELDWMALRGINLALMYTGQEKVLADLYLQFGIDLQHETGAAAFFNGPGFLSP